MNGWQRLWIVACGVWGAVLLGLVGYWTFVEGSSGSTSDWLIMLALFVFPCIASYGLGLGIAWVRRGFSS